MAPPARDRRTEEYDLLRHCARHCARRWGRRVCHIWDRGFAGMPWLAAVMDRELRFVLRWPGRYKLLGLRTS